MLRHRSGRAARASWRHALPVCLLALTLAPAIPAHAFAPSAGTWVALPAPTPPSSRFGAACAYDPVRGRMWLFGGSNGSVASNELWMRSLDPSGRWTLVVPAGSAPPARLDATMIYDAARDRFVVFGGASGAVLDDDAWALDVAGDPTWVPLAATGAPPSARYAHVAAYDAPHGRMLVFGGVDGTGRRNDTWALDLAAATPAWTALAVSGALPPPRALASAIVDPVAGRLVVFGGNGGPAGELSRELQDTWTLELAGPPAWVEAPNVGALPVARHGQRAAYDPAFGRMLVVGGSDGTHDLGDTWALDLASLTWSPFGPGTALLPPRAEHALVLDPISRRVIVFGGRKSSAALGDEAVLVLDGAPTWFGSPTARLGHAAVYDPALQEMVLFGGGSGGPPLNDVYALRLGTSLAWTEVGPLGNPPPARLDCALALDPDAHRLIVFGGKNESFNFNDTWQLALTGTPAWTQLLPTGTLPVARQSMASAFDPVRHQVLVFGGIPTGGPALNDLHALSTVGAPAWSALPAGPGSTPSGRYAHSMVYDPLRQRVVVFGGTPDEVRFFNDVWSYDLTGTPHWTQLTPLGTAPSGRCGQAAVYDALRDRMVVFGGYDGAFRNDVWELSFAGAVPRWTPLAPNGAPPSARDFMAAIVDPVYDRMIVAGGNAVSGGQPAAAIADTWVLAWGDLPTPTALTLVDRAVSAGCVRLVWYTPVGAGVAGAVERTGDGSGWDEVGRVVSDDSGRFSFEDDVAAGGRFGYRIAAGPAGERSEVTWVDVPSGLVFGLASPRPNPSRGAPVLAFVLAARGAARLDVVDVRGRRVYGRDLGALGPGPHALDLRGELPAGAGVYLAVLRRGGRSVTRKFVLLP